MTTQDIKHPNLKKTVDRAVDLTIYSAAFTVVIAVSAQIAGYLKDYYLVSAHLQTTEATSVLREVCKSLPNCTFQGVSTDLSEPADTHSWRPLGAHVQVNLSTQRANVEALTTAFKSNAPTAYSGQLRIVVNGINK